MPTMPTLPPIADQPLSVVLLARDAAGHVKQVLTGWIDWLKRRGKDDELILVDDASADGTADQAEQLAASQPMLRVHRHAAPLGEGAALRTGLGAASRPLVFYAPCLPDYRPELLEQLLAKPVADNPKDKEIDHVHLMSAFRAGAPMPAGWRALGWVWRVLCLVVFSYRPAPLPGWLGVRRWFGWLLGRILFALRHHDLASPCRLLRRDILARVPIQSNSSFAHVELLAKVNFLGHVFSDEVPIAVKPGPYRGDFGRMWRDGRRVFDHPDFGPPPVAASEAAP